MDIDKHLGTNNIGHLTLHGVDLLDLCDKNQTPLFVFDEQLLLDNYRNFTSAFKNGYSKVITCYSVKTNNNIEILRTMRKEGAYAEVASGLDLYIAKKAGFPPEKIIFDGLYKSEDALREAVNLKILIINVESIRELELIDKIAGELGYKQSIGIRLNIHQKNKFLSGENLYCHPSSRFGFEEKNIKETFRKALRLKNIQIKGIMIHPYWGMYRFLPIIKQLQKDLRIQLEYINFGGGFSKRTVKIVTKDLVVDALRQKIGLESNLDQKKPKGREIEEAGSIITDNVLEYFGKQEPTIIFEPGRFLIHDTGILLLHVRLVKKIGKVKWVVTDGGTNLVSDWLERRKIKLVNRIDNTSKDLANIVGPLLYGNDFITIKKKIPVIQEDDILALFSVGAYTISNSTQFLYPRPAVLMVRSSGEVVKARKRERYEDVIRMDKIS